MNESRIVQLALKEYAKLPGCWAVKIQTPYRRGVPDVLGCYQGRMFAHEYKRPGREHAATKLQRHTLKLIEEAGGDARVVTKYTEPLPLREREVLLWVADKLERLLDVWENDEHDRSTIYAIWKAIVDNPLIKTYDTPR